MKSYFLLFTAALFFALGLTPVVRRLAVKWGVLDLPDGERRVHQQPTPRLGGVAIFAAFVLVLAGVPLLNNILSQTVSAKSQTLMFLLVPATLIFLLGVYDDFRGLNAPVKIGVQVLAASLLYAAGFKISAISLPFGAQLTFAWWVGFPLTALWVVGITNAFNLIDGIDGLAAGASVFAMLSLFITSLIQGHPEICVASIIITGAVMGFLRYNFNPATIFLGDSGSLFLGFMCAALSLVSAQKSSTIIAVAIPLVSFGLPVTEVGLSLVRRFLSGAPVFQSDRRHIHHMLLLRGLSQRQAVILLYGVCAFFTLFGIMLLTPERNAIAMLFAVVGICILLGVQRLRYDEFGLLGDQLRRGVKLRRRVLANDWHLIQAAGRLQSVNDYASLTAILAQLFASSEFDCVSVLAYQFTPAQAPVSLTQQRVAWAWNWHKDETNARAYDSAAHWSLRVPLANEQGRALGMVTFYRHLASEDFAVDLMKLVGALRLELSAALARLQTQPATEAVPETAPAQFSFSQS